MPATVVGDRPGSPSVPSSRRYDSLRSTQGDTQCRSSECWCEHISHAGSRAFFLLALPCRRLAFSPRSRRGERSCLSVCLLACLLACLPVCLYLPARIPVRHPTACLPVYLSVYRPFRSFSRTSRSRVSRRSSTPGSVLLSKTGKTVGNHYR